jgi:hypothetical protein
MRLAVVGLAGALALVGCGGGDSSTSTPAATTTATETPQKLPKLPSGWHAYVDHRIGYAVGLAPGWTATTRADSALIRSPDRLVAISVAADRTSEALTLPLPDFATRVLSALAGFQGGLDPGPPRPFPGTPLEATQVRARGTEARNGVHQKLALVVLRRDQLVNYTLIVAENARETPAAEHRDAFRIVRTLRDEPIGPSVSPDSR